MSNQEKFYDTPTEPMPRNRRIYDAAKVPFDKLWELIRWATAPWLLALPFAMTFSLVLEVITYSSKVHHFSLAHIAFEMFSLGLVWTAYLGAVFAVCHVIGAMLKR